MAKMTQVELQMETGSIIEGPVQSQLASQWTETSFGNYAHHKTLL